MNIIEIEEEIQINNSLKEIIINTVNEVAKKEKLPLINVCVLITDREGIKYINKEYRNIDSETDVLSFPYLTYDENFEPLEDLEEEKDPETGAVCLGNMVICMDVIKEHAKEYLNTVEQELKYMTVHSMYHLLGYDHIDEEDKKIMREKEKAIVKSE